MTSSSDPPGAELRYSVSNRSDDAVWVVDDGWLVWRQQGQRIELCYARVPMPEGVQPFGYFDPRVVALKPAGTLQRSVTLIWPQPLSRLWNDAPEADPPPGEYAVTTRIGFGETPHPDPPSDLQQSVEAPVLAWQHEAVSGPVRLIVNDARLR